MTEWDGERVYYECRPDLVTWAKGCGQVAGSRRSAGTRSAWNLEWAAQWSLFGVTIEPGKDSATAGGSRALVGRDRAWCSNVSHRQHPLRVPQCRRLQMSTPRAGGARTRSWSCRPATALPLPSTAAEPGHRLRPRYRPDPAPVRRVRQVRVRDRRPRRAWRAPPGYEATFRYSLIDPEANVGGRGRCSAALRPPGDAHPGARRRRRRARGTREGQSLTDRERALLDQRAVAARAWLDASPGSAQPDDPARGAATGRDRAGPGAASLPRQARRARLARSRPPVMPGRRSYSP